MSLLGGSGVAVAVAGENRSVKVNSTIAIKEVILKVGSADLRTFEKKTGEVLLILYEQRAEGSV